MVQKMDKRISPIYKNKMDFLEKNLNIYNGKTLLDVGCGEGNYFHLYKDKEYFGIDLLESTNPRIIKCNAENILFKDNYFDTVVCMDVLEHVTYPNKVLKEIYRILKPNGKLILSVPNYNFPFTYDPINAFLRLFNKHLPIGLWAWGHKRLYSIYDIILTLNKNNFDIIKDEKKSHAFICLFVNYIPYIVSLFKKSGFKKNEKTKHNIIYKIYQKLNNIDKKYFKWTKPAFYCFVCEKR